MHIFRKRTMRRRIMSKNHKSLMYIFPAIALVSALMLGGCSIDINLNTGGTEAAQDTAQQTAESSVQDSLPLFNGC